MKLKMTNTRQHAQTYCHPSSTLSFVIPVLEAGLFSCKNTAWGRDGEIVVIIWQ